jgi:hypothetical protein
MWSQTVSDQNVGLGIRLVLINYRLLLVWKIELIELHLVGYHDPPCRQNVQLVSTDNVIRCKAAISCLNRLGNVLALSFPFFI